MDEEKIMRYAHSEGHTDLCYDDSGRYIVTCGSEGDIRIWDGFDDDFPSSHHIGDVVHVVAVKNGQIYLSSDTNSVIMYTFPKVEPDGIIAQFASTVYHITCSKSGNYIAAGGGDFIIKAVKIADRSQVAFRGHISPILSIAIEPQEIYVASSSCDGTVKVWRISDQNCVKTWDLLPKSNDFCTSSTLCRLDWHPDNGKYLAVPVDREVRMYSKETWHNVLTLTDNYVTQIASISTFSMCGSYIAAATVNGHIVVWDVKTKECISKKSHEQEIKICALAWNPSGKKELSFCDIEGQLGLFENVNNSLSSSKHQDEEIRVSLLDDIAVESDEDLELRIDKFGKKQDDARSEFGLSIAANDSEEDDENAFDIGAIKAKLEPKIFGSQEDEKSVISPVHPAIISSEITPVPVEMPSTPLQTSFQPSSTPMHLEHRFMLWNSVGIVRCYNTEEENSIDVEFHDASVYHSIHLTNTASHTMASLSTEALLMACPKDDSARSKLECMHFGTWDSNKEWNIEMEDDEEIEAITLGSGWAAAATDKRFIRLFTISGVQCEVLSAPGPIVCLVATDDQLVIAYHQGAGIPGDQNLGVMIIDIKNKACKNVKYYPLPLSSKSFLTWLGYTDEGFLCSVDTSGIVRILNVKYNFKWIPICDTKLQASGRSDHYFVVGISEIQQEIRCIPCKGSRYPSILPRPTVTVVPFNLPFCQKSTDKGRLEEEHWKLHMLHNRVKSLLSDGFDLDSEMASCEKSLTETLLKMFALATRTEHEYRAMEIADLMPTERAVQGAIKYATQRHHMALAEKLGEIVQKLHAAEYVSEDSDQEADDVEIRDPSRLPPQSYQHRKSFSSYDKEEAVLQPKPLSMSRISLYRDVEKCSSQLQEEAAVADAFHDDLTPTRTSGDSISMVLGQNNPFKIQSRAKNDATSSHIYGADTIDDVLNRSTERLCSGLKASGNNPVLETKKTSRQSKLFAVREKMNDSKTEKTVSDKKFGFHLFLEENKEKIMTDNPDVNEQDLAKLAAKLFKDLPSEEKQKYKKNNPEAPKTAKRKKDTDENESSNAIVNAKKQKFEKEKNKMLSTKTTNKLTMFSFTKTDY